MAKQRTVTDDKHANQQSRWCYILGKQRKLSAVDLDNCETEPFLLLTSSAGNCSCNTCLLLL
eukprot:630075-Amorphochlora_amoeboformis.AAC.1